MRILQNRKGAGGGGFPFMEQWSEASTLVIFLVTLVLALILVRSAAFAYLIALLLGFASGRYLELRHWRFPYFLVMLGLFLAYVIGTRYGSNKIIIFLFIVGIAVSKWLHEQGKIK